MRRDLNPRDKKETRILRATEKLLATRGFHGTRMDDIARAANLPRPNLYYYFSTKRQIYRRIITELRSEWIKAFEQITTEREPKEAISDYIREKIEYSKRHPVASKIFSKEIIRGSDMLTAEEVEENQGADGRKVRGHRVVDQGRKDGRDRSTLLLLSALGYHAVLRGL